MFNKLIGLGALIGLLLVAGCSDDDSILAPSDQFSVNEFPTEVGMWWRYESIDTLFGHLAIQVIRDTVLVEVIDSVVIRPPYPAGSRFMLWRYTYTDRVETRYVQVTPNSISIDFFVAVNFARVSWPNSYWEFPLHVGKTWSLNAGVDTTTVEKKSTVIVPAGNFDGGYLLHYRWVGFDSYGDHQSWLVPEVGIVSYRFGQYGMVGTEFNSTWQLIDWYGHIRRD